MIDAFKNICGASRVSAAMYDSLLEFNIRKYQAQYATKDLTAGDSAITHAAVGDTTTQDADSKNGDSEENSAFKDTNQA